MQLGNMIYAQLIQIQAGYVVMGLDAQAGVTSTMCRQQACSRTRAGLHRVSCSVQQVEVAQEDMRTNGPKDMASPLPAAY